MMGISQIILSLPYTKNACISSVNMFLYTLNISVARSCKFLVGMATDPSFAVKFAKDDMNNPMASFMQSINFIIHRTTMAHPYKWTVAKLCLEKSIR